MVAGVGSASLVSGLTSLDHHTTERLMIRPLLLYLLPVLAWGTTVAQTPRDLVHKVIVGKSLSSISVIGGRAADDSPGYEVTWEVVDSGVVRRALHNLSTDKMDVDDTFYRWVFVGNHLGFMPEALRFTYDSLRRPPMIWPFVQAVGQPGAGAIDVLSIGPGWVQSVQTSGPSVSVEFYRRAQ